VTGRQRADRRAGLAFVAPAALTLVALSLYPGLWVLWLSLQQRIPIFGMARFVGLDHYGFFATDPRFWNAARVTLVFTGVSVAWELALTVAVAEGATVRVCVGAEVGGRVAVAVKVATVGEGSGVGDSVGVSVGRKAGAENAEVFPLMSVLVAVMCGPSKEKLSVQKPSLVRMDASNLRPSSSESE